MTTGIPDRDTCLSCGARLPDDRNANRLFCDRTCSARQYSRVRRGTAEPRIEIDAAALLARMTPERLGWVAGIIEGEGSISVTSVPRIGNIYTYPLVNVAMTDEDMIRRLREWTGIGRVAGPFRPPSHGTHKPHWNWNVNKIAHVEALCTTIWPFLGERRRVQVQAMRQKVAERTLKRERFRN
jgi:hypothetical protein